MTSPDPVIVARGLGRTFGKTVVLEDIDLEVSPGEVLGLIGPNGGGKSTLLVLMAGLVRPTAGEVMVDGVPAHQLAQTRTGSVGLITAEPGLYPLLTGAENLQFFGGLFGLTPREVADRAAPLLAEVGLEDDMTRSVSEWSSGMKQKLSLVRALLLDPKVLLLDEPTANLDALSAQTFYVAVRRRADQGIALVIATHDLVAAERLCDRVALVAGTVPQVETLQGPRSAPEPGRLLTLLQSHGERP
jgi:ABC-2 type transport system ATP-binding protein